MRSEPETSERSLEDAARRWAAAFGDSSGEQFASLYEASGEYVDHAFQLRRSGRESIAQHLDIWHHSIAGFKMEIQELHTWGNHAFFSYVGTGTFVNDLPRLTASGLPFTFRGFIELTFGPGELIAKTEEYYSTSFAQGVPLNQYHFASGGAPSL